MTNRIDHPREHDLVGEPVLVAEVGTAFEATLSYRVHGGHDEVTGFLSVGGGTGEHGQFQLQVAVGAAAFTLDRVVVEVFEHSANRRSEGRLAAPSFLPPPGQAAMPVIGRNRAAPARSPRWAVPKP